MKTISSSLSFFLKLFAPLLSLVYLIFILVFLVPKLQGAYFNKDLIETLIYVIIGPFSLFFAVTIFLPLKRVRLEGKTLYISNYLKEISVPVGDIKQVESAWNSGDNDIWVVRIEFSTPTAFGTRIVFMPRRHDFFDTSHPPIIEELERLAKHKD